LKETLERRLVLMERADYVTSSPGEAKRRQKSWPQMNAENRGSGLQRTKLLTPGFRATDRSFADL
jgi:hypothetical protein